MTNFVDDLTDIPGPKSDLVPIGAGNPAQYIQATDWNTIRQAAYDLRAKVVALIAGGGGGGLSGLVTNAIMKATSPTTIGSSHLSDDGTNIDITGKVRHIVNNGDPSVYHASYLLQITATNYVGADGGFQVFQQTGYDTTGGPSQSIAVYAGNTAYQSLGSGGLTNYGVLAGASGGTSNYSFFGFAGTLRNDGPAILGDTTLGSLTGTGTGTITLNNSAVGNSVAWSGASCTVNLSGASSSVKATSLRSYGDTRVDGELLLAGAATDIFVYPPSANAGGTRHDVNLNASGTGGVVRINSKTGGLALTGTGGLEVHAGANSATVLGSITSSGIKTTGGAAWSSGTAAPNAAVSGLPGDRYVHRPATVNGAQWVKASVAVSGTPDTSGWEMESGATVSPAALGANQNDYAPTGIDTAAWLRLDASVANVDITGVLVAAAALGNNRPLVISHVGAANTITLKHQNAGSAAGARFLLPGAADIVIAAGGSVTLRYDLATARWRATAKI